MILKKFEYKIVDLFREKKGFGSMDDIQEFMRRASFTSSDRRAHIVEGHWKKIKGEFYWWSHHMRCRKNYHTLGFVDKQYELKDEIRKSENITCN